jgi:hypothetical protein
MLDKRLREDADLDVAREAPGRRGREDDAGEAAPRHGSNAQFRELDEMGTAFGADFSGVRIHQGDGKAEEMGAHAMTRGDDIHFAQGRGPEDRQLLGHELAHVVQQREGRVAAPQGKDGDVVADRSLEAEADRAGDAAARGEKVAPESRAKGGAAVSGAVQLFDAVDEHKAAGDDGSGHREYVWSADPKNKGKERPTEADDNLPTGKRHRLPPGGECQAPQPFEFRLTHGDIVMLSADLFDPRDSASDSLFKLAATPSSDPGKQLGTQDEIIYAIYKENPKDPRFDKLCTVEQPSAGVWWQYPKLFPDDVKKTVDNRYLRLASKNPDHFNAPMDRKQQPMDERGSSGGAYRSLHEAAIMMAYRRSHGEEDTGEAYARDAAAQHFITDAFSAGHVRTKRQSIMDYWNARYPNFFRSVKNTMVRTIAHALNQQEAAATYVVPEKTDLPLPLVGKSFRSRVRESIDSMLEGTPEASFGDIIGKVVHDVDNEEGLWVKNDLGMTWRAYGDGKMYKDDAKDENQTPEMTRQSVSLSTSDVFHAEMLGVLDRGKAARKRDEVLADVRSHTEAPARANEPKYGAEQLVPFADPDRKDDNGVQNTTASDFEDLWNLPIRSDMAKVTYGFRIRAALQPGGAFYDQLAEKGNGLEEDVSGTNPRKAFFDGFLEPFRTHVKEWMKKILADAT